MKLKFKHWVALSAILVSQQGFSQEELEDDLGLEDFLNIEVVTASKSSDKASKAPATIYVFKKDDIKKRGWSSLSSLLENLPGVQIQRKSQSEVFHNYTVRGISGVEKFIIMVNGVRVNSGTGTPHQVDYNFGINNAKQVEVILGPGSALYGVDAFAGVVNIITDEFEGQKIVDLNAGYGNFGTQNVDLNILAGTEDLSIQLMGNYYASAEPFFPDYYKEEFDWYTNNYSQNGTVALPFDPNITWPVDIKEYSTPTSAGNVVARLMFKNFEVGNSMNYQSTNTSFGMDPRYGIYGEAARRDFLINTSWAKHMLEKGKWSLSSTLLFQNMELLPRSSFMNFFSGYTEGYKYSKDQVLKLEETFTYSVTEKTELILGGTAEMDYALANTSDLPVQYDPTVAASDQQIAYLGSDIQDKNGNDLTIFQDFHELNYQNYSAYTQVKSEIKEYLNLTAGVRYDYNSRYGSAVNPRLGLVVSPANNLDVKYLFGSAYLAPSPFKTYKHYGSFSLNADSTGLTSGFFHLPNPDLKPERLKSHEVNINYRVSPNVQLTANGFYNNVTDLIVPELYFGETYKGAPVGAVERNVNKGLSETFGGSFGLDAKVNINSKNSLRPSVSYTFLDGHIDGELLPYASKHSSTLNLQFEGSRYYLNISANYRDKSKAIINGNEVSNHAITVMNLSGGVNVLEKKTFTLGLNFRVVNLLNAKYYHLPKDNELITMTNIPQDPIRFNFGMNISLL